MFVEPGQAGGDDALASSSANVPGGCAEDPKNLFEEDSLSESPLAALFGSVSPKRKGESKQQTKSKKKDKKQRSNSESPKGNLKKSKKDKKPKDKKKTK